MTRVEAEQLVADFRLLRDVMDQAGQLHIGHEEVANDMIVATLLAARPTPVVLVDSGGSEGARPSTTLEP